MSSQDYVNYLNQLSRTINTNYMISAVSIGVPCNLISILVFWRLLKNKNNMGYLGIIQSIVDLFVIFMLFFVFRSWQLFFTITPPNRDDLQCKIFTFIRRFMLHVSSWIAVVSTFDRFTYVFYGHEQRFKFMKSKLALSAIIFGIFVVLAHVYIQHFYDSQVVHQHTHELQAELAQPQRVSVHDRCHGL